MGPKTKQITASQLKIFQTIAIYACYIEVYEGERVNEADKCKKVEKLFLGDPGNRDKISKIEDIINGNERMKHLWVENDINALFYTLRGIKK